MTAGDCLCEDANVREVRITLSADRTPLVHRVVVGDLADGALHLIPTLRAEPLAMEFWHRELLELPLLAVPAGTSLQEWLRLVAEEEAVQEALVVFVASHGVPCPWPVWSEPLVPEWVATRSEWFRWTTAGQALASAGAGAAPVSGMLRIPVLSILEHLHASRAAVEHWLRWERNDEELAPAWVSLRPRLTEGGGIRAEELDWLGLDPSMDPVDAVFGPRLAEAGVTGAEREELVAWFMFQEVVNAALAPLSPRVGVAVGGDELAESPRVSVHTAALWQLYGHMEDSDGLLRKQCEVCGGWFYRQRDRAAKGQHKTVGVKYCRVQCGRTAAQRELRRRRKEARSDG